MSAKEILLLADSAGYIGVGPNPEGRWTRIRFVAGKIDGLMVSGHSAAHAPAIIHHACDRARPVGAYFRPGSCNLALYINIDRRLKQKAFVRRYWIWRYLRMLD